MRSVRTCNLKFGLSTQNLKKIFLVVWTFTKKMFKAWERLRKFLCASQKVWTLSNFFLNKLIQRPNISKANWSIAIFTSTQIKVIPDFRVGQFFIRVKFIARHLLTCAERVRESWKHQNRWWTSHLFSKCPFFLF